MNKTVSPRQAASRLLYAAEAIRALPEAAQWEALKLQGLITLIVEAAVRLETNATKPKQ